jgi:hypothetical protein
MAERFSLLGTAHGNKRETRGSGTKRMGNRHTSYSFPAICPRRADASELIPLFLLFLKEFPKEDSPSFGGAVISIAFTPLIGRWWLRTPVTRRGFFEGLVSTEAD